MHILNADNFFYIETNINMTCNVYDLVLNWDGELVFEPWMPDQYQYAFAPTDFTFCWQSLQIEFFVEMLAANSKPRL